MSKNRRNIQYTNKKHSEKGIFATILGVISFITIIIALVLSYIERGEIKSSVGAAMFLVMLFSGAGIILGVIARKEEDIFMVFPNTGIIINVINLLMISVILYAGV
ncbi:MAG: hypothetical protein J6U37_04460 [Lachnospiraceae bacterium]|nr:hypothetical protein [Lachnospiraceae bacterium]